MRHASPQTPPACIFFFTVRLQDRRSDLLLREMNRLRNATRTALCAHPFQIDDIVVLPNTIHTIWTLPEGDAEVSRRWGLLKAQFSRGLPPSTAIRHRCGTGTRGYGSAGSGRTGWQTRRTSQCTAT